METKRNLILLTQCRRKRTVEENNKILKLPKNFNHFPHLASSFKGEFVRDRDREGEWKSRWMEEKNKNDRSACKTGLSSELLKILAFQTE